MTAIGLTFSTVRFKIKGTKDDFVTLGEVESEAYASLQESMLAILNSMPKQRLEVDALPEDAENGFFLTRIETINDFRVAGILQSGGVADPAQYYDKVTRALRFRASDEHDRMLPFYFLFDGPSNSTKGIFCLQTIGIYGVKHSFLKEFEKRLKAIYTDYTPVIEVLFIGQLTVDNLLRGGVLKKIHVTQYARTGETSDANEQTVKADLHLSPLKKGGSLPQNLLEQIRAPLLSQNVDETARAPQVRNAIKAVVSELTGISIDEEEELLKATIDVEMGGHTRTIPITNLASFGTRISIEGEIEYDSYLIPNFESITNRASDIIDNSLRGRGLIVG